MSAPVTQPPIAASPELEAEARAWSAPLVRAAGEGLRALYLYGGALRPGFDPSRSDINLLLVVLDPSFETLDALAHALPKPAAKGHRFTPLVLGEETLRRSSDVFPMDFLDLLERRALLSGTDVLGPVRVSLENLRHQCEFELRSKLIGTRQAFLESRGATGAAHDILARAAGGSAALYRHLLRLHGSPRPDARGELARAVASAYGVDAAGLEAPFAERAEKTVDPARARSRLAAYLGALDRLTVAVDEIPAA